GRRRPDVSSRHDSCGKNRDDEAYEGVRVRLEARLGNMRVPLRGWVTTAHCCPPSTTVSSPLTVSAIAISAPSSFPRLPTTKSSSAVTPPGSAANSACSGLTPSSPKSAAPTAIGLPPPVARPLWLSLAPAIHGCPTHARNRATNRCRRLNTMKNSLQTENILQV